MSHVLDVDLKLILVGAITATTTVAILSSWGYSSLKKKQLQGNVYETESYLNQYLLFHYGCEKELCDPYSDRIDEKFLFFPKRLADLCIKHSRKNAKALDIGCAVGRSSFELAKHFDEVLGMDYSQQFVDTCEILKEMGTLSYSSALEGELCELCEAVIDPNIDRSKTEFRRGDACQLPASLGQFDCVLASNLLCRLRTPQEFLNRLPQLVTSSGIVVLASPYSFSRHFTPRENWFGGFKENGVDCTGGDGIKNALSSTFDLVEETNFPMAIRESKREFQMTFSHVMVWRRK